MYAISVNSRSGWVAGFPLAGRYKFMSCTLFAGLRTLLGIGLAITNSDHLREINLKLEQDLYGIIIIYNVTYVNSI